MKKVSVKNMSLLGLVLMAASAVTAAVIPDKSDSKRTNNGTLRANTGEQAAENQPNVISCIFITGGGVNSCTVSATITTGTGQVESLVNGQQTDGNTSQTAGTPGNQSSVLI